MSETLNIIAKRHSTRLFLDKPVSDSDLDKMLSSANQAPSAHNQQSWKFMIIKNRKKTELAELISVRSHDFPRASAALLRMASRSILSAPVVIAVANSGELIEHGSKLFQLEDPRVKDFFRTMEIQSSSAAVENLLIAATALGIATVWLGIMFLIKDEVLEFLGQPKGEFMAVICAGYPEKESSSPKKRPVDMLVKRLE